MKRIIGYISLIAFLALLSSGIFAHLVEFFSWLFILNYEQPDVSFAGGIVVRFLTFTTSYALVGTFFMCRYGKIMSIWYFIISSILGFVFAWIVWTIEQYILIIGIILGVLTILFIGLVVVLCLLDKKKNKDLSDSEE